MFTVGLIAGPADFLKIHSPNGGEKWTVGDERVIVWSSSGITENVRLKLYRGGGSLGPIVKSWSNSGSYPWKIPSHLNGHKITPASNYRIRIETVTESHTDWSDGPFTITNIKFLELDLEGFKKLGFIIDSPKHNNHWKTGNTYPIKWRTLVKMGPKVRLSYFPEGQPHLADAGQDSLIAHSAPNTGTYQWKISPIARAGHVQLRIRTLDNKYKADSEPFFIESPGQPHSHGAPALGAPSGASFTIKRILVNFYKPGIIDKVIVQINYSSKTAFSFESYKGHSQDGPAYLNCKIINPIWPKHHRWSHLPAEKGPPTPQVIYNHRLSVKYGGKQHLDYAPPIMDPGQGMLELVFGPKHSGKLLGLHTMQNIAGAAFSPSDICNRFYSPKLQIRIFIHTKEGIKTLYKQWYIDNAPKKDFKIGGKINICTAGYVQW